MTDIDGGLGVIIVHFEQVFRSYLPSGLSQVQNKNRDKFGTRVSSQWDIVQAMLWVTDNTMNRKEIYDEYLQNYATQFQV